MAKKGVIQKRISNELKEEIYKRFKRGESVRFLAKEYQIPYQSIFSFIRKYRRDGTFIRLQPPGRPKTSHLTNIERLKLENDILKKFQAFLKAQLEER